MASIAPYEVTNHLTNVAWDNANLWHNSVRWKLMTAQDTLKRIKRRLLPFLGNRVMGSLYRRNARCFSLLKKYDIVKPAEFFCNELRGGLVDIYPPMIFQAKALLLHIERIFRPEPNVFTDYVPNLCSAVNGASLAPCNVITMHPANIFCKEHNQQGLEMLEEAKRLLLKIEADIFAVLKRVETFEHLCSVIPEAGWDPHASSCQVWDCTLSGWECQHQTGFPGYMKSFNVLLFADWMLNNNTAVWRVWNMTEAEIRSSYPGEFPGDAPAYDTPFHGPPSYPNQPRGEDSGVLRDGPAPEYSSDQYEQEE